MSDINLITPPDKLHNHNFSILLINPSDNLRLELQELIKNSNHYFDLYLWEVNNGNEDYEWLFDVHKFVNLCILELENLPSEIKMIESYLISFGNTYFITQQENILYSKISSNRIFTVTQLEKIIRG
jgi:hypothetical protein